MPPSHDSARPFSADGQGAAVAGGPPGRAGRGLLPVRFVAAPAWTRLVPQRHRRRALEKRGGTAGVRAFARHPVRSGRKLSSATRRRWGWGWKDRCRPVVRGQKRFPGDVAHELCSPLVESACARECPGQAVEIALAPGLAVRAPQAAARAIATALRNARRHGGDACTLRITAREQGGMVKLRIADDGPGVDARTSAGCSSPSAVPTRPAPANRAGRGWASRSSVPRWSPAAARRARSRRRRGVSRRCSSCPRDDY
jgi:hypothetical protein